MPYTSKGIYYADNDTPMSIADITEQMAESIGDNLGVLQVVAATHSSRVTNTSYTSYVNSGLSATITPTRASSKILIISNLPFDAVSNVNTGPNAGQQVGGVLRLMRGTTQLASNYYSISGFAAGGGSTVNQSSTATFNYIDLPNTASAVTYSIQGRANPQSNVSFPVSMNMNSANGVASPSTMFLLEIAA